MLKERFSVPALRDGCLVIVTVLVPVSVVAIAFGTVDNVKQVAAAVETT